MKRQGFILMEILVVAFIVVLITMSLSQVLYNMGANRIYLKSAINLDSVLWEDATRAKAGAESKTYENIRIKRTYDIKENFLDRPALNMVFIHIQVIDELRNIEKSTTIVRSE